MVEKRKQIKNIMPPPPPPKKKLYRLGVKFASVIIDGWERFQHSA